MKNYVTDMKTKAVLGVEVSMRGPLGHRVTIYLPYAKWGGHERTVAIADELEWFAGELCKQRTAAERRRAEKSAKTNVAGARKPQPIPGVRARFAENGTLVLQATWSDASGRGLGQPTNRTFTRYVSGGRKILDTLQEVLDARAAGSGQPVPPVAKAWALLKKGLEQNV